MLTIRKILVPVNFTEACNAAAQFAVDLATHWNADVFLLHVLEPGGSAIGFESAAMFEEGLRSQRASACEELGRMLHRQQSEKLQRVLLNGDPATEIVNFAHSENFDLVLMPTRGYGVFRRLLLGSVAAKVLHDADCPVWTGVHPEAFNAEGVISIRSVGCAVDLGPQTGSALRWASAFAREWSATLQIMHVMSPVPDEDARHRLSDMTREHATALQHEYGTDGELHLEFGDVRSAVPEIVKRLGTDVLVIGRGHLGPGARLGGGAYAIVRDSACPVVSV